MRQPISLSIFFPAYNEEENLPMAVEAAVEAAEESPYVGQYEIIIVNDGSRDRTAEVADRLAAKYLHVRAVHHEKNRGYGAALKTGFASARMDYVFFTDADLQFDIVELQHLLVHADAHDVVVGYRAPRRDPRMRLLNAKGWNVLNRFLFGLRVRDIDCAFKLFRRDLLQSIRLHSQGAMINAELLLRLRRAGVDIKEVPVSHLPRTRGNPTGAKPSVILRALREMFSLYWGDLGPQSHKEMVRFAMVGVINTVLDAAAYFALTRFTDVFAPHLIAAKFLSFLCGTVSSFVLNRTWTFGVRDRLAPMELARFYVAVSTSLLVNIGAMYVFVSWFHIYDMFALVLSTVFTFAVNFTLSKLWVFKRRTAKEVQETLPATSKASRARPLVTP